MIETSNNQSGMTLVELLVGLVIGLFLTGGMIQAYVSTKATYNITQNVSRIQEDSRFAHYFLTRDLRETSNAGCLKALRDMNPSPNNLTSLEIRVGGWDFTGTSASDTIALTGNYTNSTTRSDWSGLNNGTNTNLPADISSIENSDVIAVKKITPLNGVRVNASSNNTSISITDYVASANETLIVGNCQRADQFIVNTVASSGVDTVIVTPTSNNFLEDWDEESRLYSLSYVYYYVSTRAGADRPSLYRWNSKDGTSEELVESVESMQVLYGLDLSDDGSANRYVSASEVGAPNWVDVVNVRVGMLMAAPGGKDTTAAQLAASYELADDITFTAAANDRTMRYITNATVKTRNLGLSTDFSICIADTNPTSDCNVLGYVSP